MQKGTASGGDIFLLCSDGLTDVLSDHDILRIFADAGQDPREISELFIRAANSGGGPDNVTAVIVCVNQ